MQILFSPTKQMNFDALELPDSTSFSHLPSTTPRFSAEAGILISRLKEFSPQELSRLMKMSETLSVQTYKLIRDFQNHQGKPALLSYSGTSYQALHAAGLDKESLSFAADHLCILSGIYGLLSPLDLIAPYRLEMKTALKIGKVKTLTAFWKPLVSNAMVEKLNKHNDDIILNLASTEYSKIIDPKMVNSRVITFHFKDKSPSGYRTVGMYAKVARGKMLRRILQEKIQNPEILKMSSTYDYEFQQEMSDTNNWVFIRG